MDRGTTEETAQAKTGSIPLENLQKPVSDHEQIPDGQINPSQEAATSSGDHKSHLSKVGLASLLAQHASSSWNARSCEFAYPLFLVILFPDTLLLASIYGFVCTGLSILLAGWIGGLVDKIERLRIVRAFIFVQKLSIIASSGSFLGLFLRVGPVDYHDAPGRAWAAFTAIVISGCLLSLANIGISIVVERDWVTSIGMRQGNETLTKLNTYMRRVDLLCKLLAPLFVSLLTSAASYTFAAAFLMGFAGLTLAIELVWIGVVFRQFPVLTKKEVVDETAQEDQVGRSKLQRATALVSDWRAFSRMPIFASSVSVSLLYLTVLSFDGSMVSYLKARQYSDAFIAGQRGLCVATSLFGTVLMPWLERKLGLVRAGAWSITSEAISLVPVLVSFFVLRYYAAKEPAWNAALLFGGMAASRIGLWAFDLCQLKELQMALDRHPKRNRFMGLQYSLQNVADLAKYVITIILSRPSQFRWAALISFISVCAGVMSYAVYVKLERKHVFHLDRIPLVRKTR